LKDNCGEFTLDSGDRTWGGGIKPCVSAFVGDQFLDQDEKSLRKVYGLFYWSINIGAFFGFAVIPRFRDVAGYSWAFALPGIFMGIATLVFWLGRRRYVIAPPARTAVQAQSKTNLADTLKVVGRIALIFLPIPIFWALFNQVNSTWVFQGTKMQPFHILGYKVDAESIQSVGALLVLIWVPVLTFGVYPLAERLGFRPTPLRRIGIGLFLAAFSYLVCAAIQMSIDQGQKLVPTQKLSIAWQVVPYIILEAGEGDGFGHSSRICFQPGACCVEEYDHELVVDDDCGRALPRGGFY
jgi:POT family proton-dependent oligopeptide transporter